MVALLLRPAHHRWRGELRGVAVEVGGRCGYGGSHGAAFRPKLRLKVASPNTSVCTVVSWPMNFLPSSGAVEGLEK